MVVIFRRRSLIIDIFTIHFKMELFLLLNEKCIDIITRKENKIYDGFV